MKFIRLISPDFIQNYGINPSTQGGKEKLINIAQKAAKHDNSLPMFIGNYRIDSSCSEGKKALFEIAKVAAHQSWGQLSQFIPNFGFDPKKTSDQQALFEIAKIAAKGDRAISRVHPKLRFR